MARLTSRRRSDPAAARAVRPASASRIAGSRPGRARGRPATWRRAPPARQAAARRRAGGAGIADDWWTYRPSTILLVQQHDEAGERPDERRQPCGHDRMHELRLAQVLGDL